MVNIQPTRETLKVERWKTSA